MTAETTTPRSSNPQSWISWLRSVPISRRLFSIIGVAAVGFVVYMWFALTSFESELLDSRRMKTEHLVEAAWAAIDGYHQQELAGELTAEEAQAAAMATVKSMR